MNALLRKILPFAVAGMAAWPAPAQQKVTLDAGVRFDGVFINDEFDVSEGQFRASGTVAGVRMSPYLGLSFGEGSRLMAGVDLRHDFGSGKWAEVEVPLWYQQDRRFGKNHFTFAAGMFPRALLCGGYSTAILSDAARFNDNNLEGLLLQLRGGRSHYEVALDWNGRYGPGVHEQFNVITAGEWVLPGGFSAGWQGMFHHWANSLEVKGVVDDNLINPYIRFDAARRTGFRTLSLKVGLMAGYQRDRIHDNLKIPVGADLVLDVCYRHFGLVNELYTGDSLAPFYRDADASGAVYGSRLYMRSSLWQAGSYDRLELYWAPVGGKSVSIRLRLVAHFADGLCGTQQMGQITVNLEDIYHRKLHQP